MSDRKWALLAGGAAALAAVAGLAWLWNEVSKEEEEEEIQQEDIVEKQQGATAVQESKEEESASGDAPMKKADLLKLLDEVLESVTRLQADIDEELKRGDIKPESVPMALAERIQTAEQELQEKYGVTEDQVVQAQDYYSKDKDVSSRIDKMREILGMGSVDTSIVPEDLTKEQFMEKLKVFLEDVTDKMEKALTHVKESGMSGQQALMGIHAKMTELQESEDNLEELTGLNKEVFSAAIAKWQEDPQIGAMFQEHQMKQQQQVTRILMGQ